MEKACQGCSFSLPFSVSSDAHTVCIEAFPIKSKHGLELSIKNSSTWGKVDIDDKTGSEFQGSLNKCHVS